jgi:hypothetical protein
MSFGSSTGIGHAVALQFRNAREISAVVTQVLRQLPTNARPENGTILLLPSVWGTKKSPFSLDGPV